MSHLSSHIQMVAFDLGGVLVDVDLQPTWRELGLTRQQAEECFFQHPGHDDMATGRISGRTFVNRVSEIGSISADRVFAAWAAVVKPRPEAMDLVRSLKCAGTIWSNTDPIHFTALENAIPSSINTVRQRTLSYEIGHLKPDKEFFIQGLQRLPVEAAKLLYVDDRMDNLESARELGIQAVQVESVAQLSTVLKQFDVIF